MARMTKDAAYTNDSREYITPPVNRAIKPLPRRALIDPQQHHPQGLWHSGRPLPSTQDVAGPSRSHIPAAPLPRSSPPLSLKSRRPAAMKLQPLTIWPYTSKRTVCISPTEPVPHRLEPPQPESPTTSPPKKRSRFNLTHSTHKSQKQNLGAEPLSTQTSKSCYTASKEGNVRRNGVPSGQHLNDQANKHSPVSKSQWHPVAVSRSKHANNQHVATNSKIAISAKDDGGGIEELKRALVGGAQRELIGRSPTEVLKLEDAGYRSTGYSSSTSGTSSQTDDNDRDFPRATRGLSSRATRRGSFDIKIEPIAAVDVAIEDVSELLLSSQSRTKAVRELFDPRLQEHRGILPPHVYPVSDALPFPLRGFKGLLGRQLEFSGIERLSAGNGHSSLEVVRSCAGPHPQEGLGFPKGSLRVLKIFKGWREDLDVVARITASTQMNKECAAYTRIEEAMSAGEVGFHFLMMADAIVTIQNDPCLVLPLMMTDLGQLMDKSKAMIPRKDSRRILAQTIVGLATLHTIGVIHNDIKPQNIFLGDQRNVKLGDFGLSHVTECMESLKVSEHYDTIRLGTPGYIAPEKVTGEGYSYPVDYWSLGWVLYELISERKRLIDALVDDNALVDWAVNYHTLEARKNFFKEERFDKEALDLLCGLLDPQPQTRMGLEEVLLHPFFNDDDGLSEFMDMQSKGILHCPNLPDTPRTPVKSIPTTGTLSFFSATPFYRKLSGNPSLTKSLIHVHMDPALKEELAESILTDVPGLMEHLFPDTMFPIPFERLYKKVYGKQWNTQLNDWKAFFVKTYSGTTGGRVVPGTAETDLAKFLNTLGETIRDAVSTSKRPKVVMPPKRIWDSESQKALEGGPNAQRKPDVCLINDDGIESAVSWTSTLVPMELKSNAGEYNKALLQLVNSAYMILSTQDERRFVIGVSLCGSDVRVYVFDRSGVVGSKKFDFSVDSGLLVRLFAGLMFSDAARLGLDPTIRRDSSGARYVSVANLEYQIIRQLFISDSIRGRGTTCWHATRCGQDYVIKDSWADVSRIQTEAEILRAATGVEGVAQLVAEEVVQINGQDDTTASVRSIIRDAKDYSPKKMRWYEKVEVRLHRRLVTTPVAESLTKFRSKRELLKVLIGAIQAHARLVERHILHRDISMNNVLIQRVPLPPKAPNESPGTTKFNLPSIDNPPVQNERVQGILIDLDYALITEDENGNKFERSCDPSGHRTGTLPFMATEILIGLEPGQEHQSHHDMESFFFILLWIALHYAGPNDVERQDMDVDKVYPVLDWLDGNNIKELGTRKEKSMLGTTKAFNRDIGVHFTKYFKDMIPCVNELRRRIFSTDDEDERPKVTDREMVAILQKHHDLLPEVENWSHINDEEGYRGGSGKRKLASIKEEDGVDGTLNIPETPSNRKRARTSIKQASQNAPRCAIALKNTNRAARNSERPKH